MTPVPSWKWLWRYVTGALVIGLLGLRYYADHAPLVPLQMVELGIHESGHWSLIWAPRTIYFLGGTVAQIAVPLAVGAYLALRMRDPLGGAAGLAWAGLSCHGAAVYIADAPYERLQLVGGDTHDWAWLLGPDAFDAIGSAAGIAQAVRVAGILMIVAAAAWCAAMPAVISRRGALPEPPMGRMPAPEPPPAE
ncbi:MAG: hypothetical protein IT200_05670 [Thermoleophilia bacterium]|nr:hypothetical protein [Thermoleophilia bacterium]